MIHLIKIKYHHIRHRLKENSYLMLIWLLNFFPKIGGFPLQTNKISALFMFVHVFLHIYLCIVGTVAYLMYVADGFYESIISLFNISIFGVVMNNTLWFMFKKKDLSELINMAMENDELLINSDRFVENYRNLIKKIKIVLFVLYAFHFVNDYIIYIPTRIFFMENFSVVSCVGFDLTSSPSREMCMFLLTIQEITAVIVVASYDAFVLFIFSHTTAIFQILYEDMESFAEISKNENISEETTSTVSDRLLNIIVRHSAVLRTIDKMQHIFSVAIGYGFAQNAISLCLFFVLPMEVSLNFGPLIYYAILMFFLYCYNGQRLTNASEKFEIAVYTCGWERLCVREQKSILLILKQAQKPVVVKAGTIVPISVYTFATAMQSIYKFVTVFKL